MNAETDPRSGVGATGFSMKPDGPLHIRDYSNEAMGRLKALYVLVDGIMERYPDLIPGQLNRLMRLWHADLSTAILAKDPSVRDGEFDQSARDAKAAPAEDRYAQAAAVPVREGQ